MSDNQRVHWCYTVNNYKTKAVIPDELCRYRIQGYEVGDEGTPHIQGFVTFIKKIRFATLQTNYPGVHWIQANGTPYQNRIYCSKDGDFEEIGEKPKEPKQKDTTYQEAYAASTVREGLNIIKASRPRDLAIHGEAIERNLKKAKISVYKPTYQANQFNLPLQPLTITTLITGASNTGKTHYACAHFTNPLLVSHIDQLKSLSPDNDGIVFDDMSFKHWPPEAVIHILDIDFDRTINVRYGTVIIPAHTKKIFTHNTYNPFYNDDIDDQQKIAIDRRFTRVNVLNKLY